MKQSYPKWLYSASGAQIAPDAAAHAALGSGWVESPADVVAESAETAPRIKIDKRWSAARIAAEIEKAKQ